MMPHVQPTGIALLALAGELDGDSPDPRLVQSLNFLERAWPDAVGTASVCFAAMGLAAHGVRPDDTHDRLAAAAETLGTRGNAKAAYKLTLLALASLGDRCPLIWRS